MQNLAQALLVAVTAATDDVCSWDAVIKTCQPVGFWDKEKFRFTEEEQRAAVAEASALTAYANWQAPPPRSHGWSIVVWRNGVLGTGLVDISTLRLVQSCYQSLGPKLGRVRVKAFPRQCASWQHAWCLEQFPCFHLTSQEVHGNDGIWMIAIST